MKDYIYGMVTMFFLFQVFYVVDDSVPNGLGYYLDLIVSI